MVLRTSIVYLFFYLYSPLPGKAYLPCNKRRREKPKPTPPASGGSHSELERLRTEINALKQERETLGRFSHTMELERDTFQASARETMQDLESSRAALKLATVELDRVTAGCVARDDLAIANEFNENRWQEAVSQKEEELQHAQEQLKVVQDNFEELQHAQQQLKVVQDKYAKLKAQSASAAKTADANLSEVSRRLKEVTDEHAQVKQAIEDASPTIHINKLPSSVTTAFALRVTQQALQDHGNTYDAALFVRGEFSKHFRGDWRCTIGTGFQTAGQFATNGGYIALSRGPIHFHIVQTD